MSRKRCFEPELESVKAKVEDEMADLNMVWLKYRLLTVALERLRHRQATVNQKIAELKINYSESSQAVTQQRLRQEKISNAMELAELNLDSIVDVIVEAVN